MRWFIVLAIFLSSCGNTDSIHRGYVITKTEIEKESPPVEEQND